MGDIIITIAVIVVILFIFSGFVAIVLDQRAEARHWEEMWNYEHRENEKLANRIVELHQELRQVKEKHLV